jgi:hypothetical protein
MNTSSLMNALSATLSCTFVKNWCVVAQDELKMPESFPSCVISNTMPKTHKGLHWVAFFFKNKHSIEFWDSYGKSPKHYNFIFKIRQSNKMILQSYNSDVCGLYCIMFLSLRANGVSFLKIKKMFSKNTFSNDCIVLTYFKKLPKCKYSKRNICTDQICQAFLK